MCREAWRGDEGIATRGVPTKLELSTLLRARIAPGEIMLGDDEEDEWRRAVRCCMRARRWCAILLAIDSLPLPPLPLPPPPPPPLARSACPLSTGLPAGSAMVGTSLVGEESISSVAHRPSQSSGADVRRSSDSARSSDDVLASLEAVSWPSPSSPNSSGPRTLSCERAMLSESWVHARFSGSARQLLLSTCGAGSLWVWASGIALPRRCASEEEGYQEGEGESGRCAKTKGEGYQVSAGIGTHDMLPSVIWRLTRLMGEMGPGSAIGSVSQGFTRMCTVALQLETTTHGLLLFCYSTLLM